MTNKNETPKSYKGECQNNWNVVVATWKHWLNVHINDI